MKSVAARLKANPPGMVDRPAKAHSDADPACQRCGGFGWRQSARYANHWLACNCTWETIQKFQEAHAPKPDLSRIGLLEDEMSMTWDMIKPDISDGIKAVRAIRPKYDQGYGMIYLYGAWGQGKTLIGKILTATARRDHNSAAYANMTAVLDDIRLSFDKDDQNTELLRRMAFWTKLDVLFIDELDKCNPTAWARDRMFQLLDQRYARAIREEALTVIASNVTDGELDGYLQSRLNDNRIGPVVYLNGPDARRVMPSQYKF
jgi:DNA replication protein DnaC